MIDNKGIMYDAPESMMKITYFDSVSDKWKHIYVPDDVADDVLAVVLKKCGMLNVYHWWVRCEI